MKRYTFPKEKRLRSNRLFREVISSGQCFRDKLLTVYIAKNNSGFSRLGVSVSKSCGNAVKRNRLKRLVREVFRLNQYDIPKDYDYLVLIKRKIEQPSFELIKESFISLVLQRRWLNRKEINNWWYGHSCRFKLFIWILLRPAVSNQERR